MIIIDSPSYSAYFNIALEEYLLYKFPTETIFVLYLNSPSIIIGKFQNTLAEINLDFIRENNINVVRRMSGGGAVYHDLGNLNFSFHTLLGENDFMDFSKFTKPVLHLLQSLDVPAVLEGRNDLLVDGKKFSGNAKLAKNGKMIQHGTILFDSDMSVLSEALKINPLKYKDKAVKSNQSRVINLKKYFSKDFTIDDLKSLLVKQMMEQNPNSIKYLLNNEDHDEINKLIEIKYKTWDWNFGFSPKYSFKNAIKIPAGFIELHLDIAKGGLIENAKIFGDFFASKSIEDIEQLITNEPHDLERLKQILSTVDLTEYFGKVTIDEMMQVFK